MGIVIDDKKKIKYSGCSGCVYFSSFIVWFVYGVSWVCFVVFFQLGVFSFPLMSDGRGAVLSIKASAHPHGPCANSNTYLLLT